LHIVELAESAASASTGKVIKLAAWTDNERKALAPHRPEATGIVVNLGADEQTPDEIEEESRRDGRR